MSASFQRRRTVARNPCTSGMRMALDCARGVYEAVDRRMPEATALELMIAGPEGGPSSDMQRYEG